VGAPITGDAPPSVVPTCSLAIVLVTTTGRPVPARLVVERFE
jgi:hypothetical protein